MLPKKLTRLQKTRLQKIFLNFKSFKLQPLFELHVKRYRHNVANGMNESSHLDIPHRGPFSILMLDA